MTCVNITIHDNDECNEVFVVELWPHNTGVEVGDRNQASIVVEENDGEYISLPTPPHTCPHPLTHAHTPSHLPTPPHTCPHPLTLATPPHTCPHPLTLATPPHTCPHPLTLVLTPSHLPHPLTLVLTPSHLSSPPHTCPHPICIIPMPLHITEKCIQVEFVESTATTIESFGSAIVRLRSSVAFPTSYTVNILPSSGTAKGECTHATCK